MLEVQHLHSYYGKSHILRDVSLSVGAGEGGEGGEVVGILGRNGVGKTTLLRSIVGFVSDVRGEILLDGQSVLGLSAAELARRGLVYIRESRMIFGTLSVGDNLRLAGGDVSAIYDRFPRLAERRHHLGSQLSGGEQKILALARGLLMQPRYLLLDEIGEGLSPMILAEVREILLRLVGMGVGILLVEQNLSFGLSVMGKVHVLHMGEIRFSGGVDELRKNENLQRKLLSV